MGVLGTNKSKWRVAFNPSTGDHVPHVGSDGKVYNEGPDAAIFRRIPAHFEPATYQFEDTLEVRGWGRTPSGANITLVDSRVRLHTMSLTEFMRLVPDMHGGRISGRWGYAKIGSSTLLQRVG